jgi:DNA-binding FadR family transcriptional regulator
MQKPITRVSLQSEIIKYIQEYIKENNLSPGGRLPSQGEFIDMMQVSRTALREAVKTLEAGGVIEVKNGKGLYVGKSRKVQDTIASLLSINKEKEQLLEMVEARRALETEILDMVIHKATDEELQELGKVEKVLMEKHYAGLQQTQEDKQFHQTIYGLCHNNIMYSLISILSEKMEELWEFPLNMKDPFAESMPYHHTLYEAICERNVHKAKSINNKLLECVYRDIISQ